MKKTRAKAPRLVLAQCERVLLEEIASAEFKRRDVALTYRLAMFSGETVDWTRVNRAIVMRWSPSGLQYIKRLAWNTRASGSGTAKERG